MTFQEISQYRLASQKLLETNPTSPQAIVHHMGAMQAQDYAMAKWAIGVRCNASEKEIEDAIDSGKILRTHILRPTWHFVAAEDIHWMLELSGPQVKRFTTSAAKKCGLDEKKLHQINNQIEKMLSGNNHLTRNEIMQELTIKKTTEQDFLYGTIMMHAELGGLVCNGKMRGKQMTYSLLEEKVPKPKSSFTKEEALAKLAQKYFESHGPATLEDFSWWSGFAPTTAKITINAIESELNSVVIENQKYWFGKNLPLESNFRESVHFLPAFDEILISYKNREASILKEHQPIAFTNNGIFKPIILQNGKVIGTWKRTIEKGQTIVKTHFFAHIDKLRKKELFKEILLLEKHLDVKIIIE